MIWRWGIRNCRMSFEVAGGVRNENPASRERKAGFFIGYGSGDFQIYRGLENLEKVGV